MLVEKQNDLKIESSENFKSGSFTIKASAEAFQILSSSLYQDKIAAVIRELSTNCFDAHRQAEKGIQAEDGSWIVAPKPNQTQIPFDVTLPTTLNPVFKVRDYGVGLSEEDVFELYTTYFGSTKQQSNDFVGALGLGSKSPFSIVSSFLVISFFNGTRTVYTAIIGEDGFPSIVKMDQQSTSEQNGIEINITVDQASIYNFSQRASTIYMYFDVKPNFKGSAKPDIPVRKYHREGEGWGIRSDGYASGAVQGLICYQLSLDALAGKLDADIHSFMKELSAKLELRFKIGDVDIAASREALSYTDKTIKAIDKKLRVIRDDYSKQIIKEVADNKNILEAYAKINSYRGIDSLVCIYLMTQHQLKWRNIVIKKSLQLVPFNVTATIPVVTKQDPLGQSFEYIKPYTPAFKYLSGNIDYQNYTSNEISVDPVYENKTKVAVTRTITHFIPVPASHPGKFYIVLNDAGVPLYKLRKFIANKPDWGYHNSIIINKNELEILESVKKATYITEHICTSSWVIPDMTRELVKFARVFRPKILTNDEDVNSGDLLYSVQSDDPVLEKITHYIVSEGSAFNFRDPFAKVTTETINAREFNQIVNSLISLKILPLTTRILVIPKSKLKSFNQDFEDIKYFDEILNISYADLTPDQQVALSSVLWYNKLTSKNKKIDTSLDYRNDVSAYEKFLKLLAETKGFSSTLNFWGSLKHNQYMNSYNTLISSTNEGSKKYYITIMDTLEEKFGKDIQDLSPVIKIKTHIEYELKKNFPIFVLMFKSFAETGMKQVYNYNTRKYEGQDISVEHQQLFNNYIIDDWKKYAVSNEVIQFLDENKLKEAA